MLARALPAAFALIALALAANALRLLWRCARMALGYRVRPAGLDDAFVNASAAFLFFTLTLVFSQ